MDIFIKSLQIFLKTSKFGEKKKFRVGGKNLGSVG